MRAACGRRACWSLFLCILLLPGCWQAPSVDNEAFIDTLAIAYDKGLYHVWVTVVNPSGNTQEGASVISLGSPDNPLWVAVGHGSTFIEAVNNLYPTSTKRLMWSQLSTVILHESVLRHQYLNVVRTLVRYYEIRYTVWIYGTRDNLPDILRPNLAIESNPLYQYARNPDRAKQLGFVMKSKHLYEFLRELQGPAGTTLLPELRLNRDPVNWFKEHKPADFYSIMTAGVLRQGRFIGWLPSSIMPGIFWARIGGTRLPLYLRKPDGKRVAATLYVRHIKSHISPVIGRSRLRFDLQMEGTMDLSELTAPTPERTLIRQAEETVAREVRRSFAYGVTHHADLFNLTVGVYRMRSLPWSSLAHLKGKKWLTLTPSSLRTVRVHLTLVHSAMRAAD